MTKEGLIFGASGFIGQNLSQYLGDAGIITRSISLRDVSILDNLLVSDHSIYINLVGKAHDHKGRGSENEFFYANFEIAKLLFQHFLKSPSKLFIHISSIAAVEEVESRNDLTESAPCFPRTPYGRSKRVAEEWLLSQNLPSGKKMIVIRPPMVHGSGDKGNLSLLYKMISRGIPYPLSAFENRRSFISINNFGYFINLIIRNSQSLESGVYHVSDNEAVSTLDIIKIIEDETKHRTINLRIPKYIIYPLAKIGDRLRLPFNSKRLNKMTCDLIVSNSKIKDALQITELHETAIEGLRATFKSFTKHN